MTLHAVFTRNQNEVTTGELFQWDIGQQLCIEGLTDIDENTKVHFANNRMSQAIVKTGTFEDNALTVDIPNEFLQSGGVIHGKAWVYVTESETVGQTIKTINIPIVPRTRPNDYVSPADPDSKGIVEQALEILRDGTKVSYVTTATVDNATETGKVYYTTVGSSKALIVPVSGESSQVQFRLDRDGKIYSRRREKQNGAFPAWGSFADISAGVDPEIIRQIVEAYIAEHGIDLTGVERTDNRVNAINAQSDDEHYPTAGAVRRVYQSLDEADANIRSSIGSLESGKANKSETYTKTQVDTALSGKANSSDIPDISGKADKATTLAGYGITDAYKKIEINQMFNQVDADLQGKADAIDTYTKTQTDTLLNAKESTANKVTAVGSSASDTQYPSARAVYQIVSTVANNSEVKTNKVTAIGSGSTDTQYPSAKAVYTELSGKADKSNTYTKSEVDALVSGGVVPQYVIDEAESVLAKAFAHKGLGRTIRFIAVSDSHNDATEASYAYTRVSNQHCGQAVKYIADRIPLDFVASLGDMTWAGVAHTTAQYQTDWLKEDIQEMNLFLKDGFSGVPNIRVVGNHDQCATTDSGGTVSRLQNSGAYQYFGRYNAGVSDGLSNYGYYDLNNVKVRIIYLNTSDAVNVSSQGTYLGMTAGQKNWLCETLIDLNTKTDAASWKILLMSHAPLDMISGLAADILIPYTNGGTYGSYTFTNHSAKIIGNCHGHTHCYNVGYISDTIRRFTIPNSNFYDNNHYKNNANYAAWTEETTYPKTQNSRTDTSFSLVTIDLDNLTCYVDNYGAGYDRNFSVDHKKTVSSISNLSYTGTTTVGQNIDTSAISYTVNYSDGSTSSRTGNVTVSPVTIQQVGNNAITVSYTENGTTVTGNLTIAGTAPPVVRLLDLDRTEATAAVDALIPFDTTKYYTNIANGTAKGYGTNCTVYSKTSDSISLKESGTGGITVGYPVELPDTSSSYTFSCDYNGTGRARIYYRSFDSSGTSNTSTTPYITNDTSATGSVTATIAAPGGNYKWLIIMFGSNTAGEKEYTNVSLTKNS